MFGKFKDMMHKDAEDIVLESDSIVANTVEITNEDGEDEVIEYVDIVFTNENSDETGEIETISLEGYDLSDQEKHMVLLVERALLLATLQPLAAKGEAFAESNNEGREVPVNAGLLADAYRTYHAFSNLD